MPFFLSCVGHVGAQNVATVLFKTHYGVVLLFVCVFLGGIPSLHALVFI